MVFRVTASPAVKTYWPNLDILRLFLAVEVMSVHYYKFTTGQVFPFLIPAVPAFLAVTGVTVLQSRFASRSTSHFAWKRILRVQPGLLLNLAFIAYFIDPLHALWAVRMYASCGWNGFDGKGGNGVLWSLGCEEVAYIVLAVAFAFGAYKKPWFAWAGLLGSIGFWLAFTPFWRGMIDNYVLLGACFFMGNLAYLYRDAVTRFAKPWGRIAIACALLPYACLSLRWPTTSTAFLLFSVAAAACALLFGMGTPIQTRPAEKRTKVDLSYSIYLLHPVVYVALADFCPKGIAWIPAAVLTLALSWLSWTYIELPALKLKNWTPKHKKPTAEPLETPEPVYLPA